MSMPHPDRYGFELPSGLNHVLGYVSIGQRFPPKRNSRADVALLRIANRFLQRRCEGRSDFLLIVTDGADCYETEELLSRYGLAAELCVLSLSSDCRLFPRRSNVTIEEQVIQEDEERLYFERCSESASVAIEEWIKLKHAAAVPFPMADYDDGNIVWSGIEASPANEFDQSLVDSFKCCVPDRVKPTADTWFAIFHHLAQASRWMKSPGSAESNLKFWMYCCCHWMAVCNRIADGDVDGCFDPESVAAQFGISDFDIGCLAAGRCGRDLLGRLPGKNETLRTLLAKEIECVEHAIVRFFGTEESLRNALVGGFRDGQSIFYTLYRPPKVRLLGPSDLGEGMDSRLGAGRN